MNETSFPFYFLLHQGTINQYKQYRGNEHDKIMLENNFFLFSKLPDKKPWTLKTLN